MDDLRTTIEQLQKSLEGVKSELARKEAESAARLVEQNNARINEEAMLRKEGK